MLAYLRQNTLAFIALCVALFSLGGATAYAVNTVRSTDIVDGQVLTQDLANNAVTTAKIKDGQVTNADLAANSVGGGKILDNNITGADVNEATLSRVPDAAKLNGHAWSDFHIEPRATWTTTTGCSSNQVWIPCAGVIVTVPDGHEYAATVISTVTLNPGNTTAILLACAAYTGPTCILGDPDTTTFPANQYTNATYSGLRYLTAGTYTLSTAIKTPFVIPSDNRGHTVTTVMLSDISLSSP